MKKHLWVALAICLAVGGYFGYQSYARNQLIDALTPLVKNASLQAVSSTRLITEKSTQVTFADLLAKLSSSLDEVNKKLIDVQTLSSAKTASVTDPVVAYLKATDQFLRAVQARYRAELAFNTATSSAEMALDNLRTSNSYSYAIYKRSSDKAMAEGEEKLKEFKASLDEARDAATALKTARAAIAQNFPDDALVPLSELDHFLPKPTTKSREWAAASTAASAASSDK